MYTERELCILLMGGAGTYMILSVHGLPSDYWAVVTGAWAYGLIGGWMCYGKEIMKPFSKNERLRTPKI